jgi:hypothetical protein
MTGSHPCRGSKKTFSKTEARSGESYFVLYVWAYSRQEQGGRTFSKHPVRNTKVGRSSRQFPPFVLADLSMRVLVYPSLVSQLHHRRHPQRLQPAM